MTPMSGVVSILIGLGAIAAGLWSAWFGGHETRPGPERAILERRVESLEALLGASRGGPLIPFDQALVVIGRPVLQRLLDVAMPYETQADGRFRVRVHGARVACEDGLALVRLDGRASFLDRPEEDGFVEATVFGALREFDLEPDENVLRGRVDVIAIQVHRVETDAGRSDALKGLLQDLAELRVETLRDFEFAFDIPVRLVDEIVLPEMRVRPGVRVPEARVPLHASVTAVVALADRLWISVRLRGMGEDSVAVAGPVAQASR